MWRHHTPFPRDWKHVARMLLFELTLRGCHSNSQSTKTVHSTLSEVHFSFVCHCTFSTLALLSCGKWHGCHKVIDQTLLSQPISRGGLRSDLSLWIRYAFPSVRIEGENTDLAVDIDTVLISFGLGMKAFEKTESWFCC